MQTNSSMNEQHNRPLFLLASLETLRFQSPSMDIFIIRTLKPELFSFTEILVVQRVFGEMRDLLSMTSENNKLFVLSFDFVFQVLEATDNKDVIRRCQTGPGEYQTTV